MGLVVNKLTDQFGPGTWVIEKNTYKNTCIKDTQAKLIKIKNKAVVVTSPLDRPLLSYYICD